MKHLLEVANWLSKEETTKQSCSDNAAAANEWQSENMKPKSKFNRRAGK